MLLADQQGAWSYRQATATPKPGETPDETARRLSGIHPDNQAHVVHSTSWRHQPDRDQIILTYAVCPDPNPEAPRTPLTSPTIARGSSPATPSPDQIEPANVAAHAIQHLAFLRSTDPVVERTLEQWPTIAMALAFPTKELDTARA